MAEPKLVAPAVAVIGGGPAGLSLARTLTPQIDGEVVVFDREREAGGIPRHADHPGYGIRDRKRFMSGPAYAESLVREATGAGAQICTRTMVHGWADDRTLEATSPSGRLLIRPRAFVFATGARERPRTARGIPGSRPGGVLTTGQLQNLVHLKHARDIGTRAVVVGAELVSWSAVMTLKEAGCGTEALISRYPKGESYALFRVGGRAIFRTRVRTETRVTMIHGKHRVTGVEVESLRTGEREVVECDTVVFTGDWIPDNELLRMRGVELDPSSLSPITDQTMQTSVPGIFSVGNVNHPVETADVVALAAEYAAGHVADFLSGGVPQGETVELAGERPIRWIFPKQFDPRGPAPARKRLVAWVDEFVARPALVVHQGGHEIARRKLAWPAVPGRAFRIPSSVLDGITAGGGAVSVSLRGRPGV